MARSLKRGLKRETQALLGACAVARRGSDSKARQPLPAVGGAPSVEMRYNDASLGTTIVKTREEGSRKQVTRHSPGEVLVACTGGASARQFRVAETEEFFVEGE